MLAEALKYLTQLSERGMKHESIAVPGRKILHVLRGELREYDDRPGRLDAVNNPESLVLWIDRATIAQAADLSAGAAGDSSEPIRPEIFIHPNVVRVRIGFDDARVHECYMQLDYSEQWQALQSWFNKPHTQREVIRLLRGPLRGTCPETLLQVLRRIEFRRTSDGRSSLEHGKESLGKSIEAQARSSAGEIPEGITFELPMYEQIRLARRIHCELELDTENYTIGLLAVGDTVTTTRDFTLNHLAGMLREQLEHTTIMLAPHISVP